MLSKPTLQTAGAIVVVASCAVAAPRIYDVYCTIRLQQSLAHLQSVIAGEQPPRSRTSSAVAPRSRPSRGAMDLASVQIDAAIAQVVNRAVALRSPDGRRAAALAHHYARRFGVAARELENIARATNAAADWNDLAATHLETAADTRAAERLLNALVAVNHALEIEPRFAPALYNRAVILESLGLREHARSAWQRCLLAETDSSWHAIIAHHVKSLPAASDDDTWAGVKQRLTGASPAELHQVVERFRQQSRIYATTVLPMDWAAATLANDTKVAGEILNTAKRLAAVIATVTGDPFAAHAVDIIERTVRGGDAERIRRLALAYSVYREGRILYKDHDVARAEAKFRSAIVEFAALRSPMQFVARHYAALTLVDQNREAEAAPEFRAIAGDLDPSYVALRAEIGWRTAYQEGVGGRWDAALSAASASANDFRALGEKESTGAMENLLAEIYDFLGQSARAWQHRVVAFSLLSEAGDPYRLQVALAGASRPYIRQKNSSAAIALLDLEIERSDFPENINLRADAMARRARVRAARGDLSGARADLASGRAAAALIPDPEARMKLVADLDEATGIAERSHDAALSLCFLTNAIGFYESAKRSILLPELFLERARSHLQAGHLDLAQTDLDAGIDALEKQRAAVSEFESAATITDPAAELFIEAVRLAVRKGDVRGAFAYSERSRGRALSQRSLRARTETVPRLDADLVAVEYMLLPEQLVIFTAGRELEMKTVALSEEKVNALVRRLSWTIKTSSQVEVREASIALSEVLLRPVEATIRSASAVVFVASGVLGQVPWAALYDRQSGRYLTEKVSVRTEPSVEILTARSRAEAPQSAADALIVGNPRSSSPLFDRLPSLAHAEAEARNVASLYPAAIPLLGQDASKRRVVEQISRYGILHFAGHAVSSLDGDAESFLVLASEEPGDSGLLYAREISRLDLRHARMVVLAACGTLSGSTVHLDGTPSIAQSFLAAGASAVIATLWDIDDARSARLFSEIHRRVISGESVSEALRAVQLRALSSHDPEMAHPRTWAGITLVGGADP
jgi:CHAT domain-containing protein